MPPELFYGYSEEEVSGRNLVEVLVPPEARSEFRSLIAGMLESGRAPEAREMLLLHRTGREVPVLTGHAAVTGHGNDKELFRFDIDLSERKQTEAELRVAATAFRSPGGHDGHRCASADFAG